MQNIKFSQIGLNYPVWITHILRYPLYLNFENIAEK